MAELIPIVRIKGEGGSIASGGSGTAPTVTELTSSATVITLQAANDNRKQWAIYNLADKDLYLKWGSGASLTDFTVIVPYRGYYELPLPTYLGIITGIWGTAPTGKAYATELI